MNFKSGIMSPLARAKGLGSAKEGTHHWWLQRLTALANLPLLVWLVWNMVSLLNSAAGFTQTNLWISQPINTILLLVLLVNIPYHAALGLQVVIEDYVTCKVSKYALLIGTKFVLFGGAVASIYSVLKIALS